MKFFIPAAKDDANAEVVYNSIIKFVAASENVSNDRIYSISYKHNGVCFSATTGEEEPRTKEIVVAIIKTEQLYFVCTPNHDVLQGSPIFVGKNEIRKVIKFD